MGLTERVSNRFIGNEMTALLFRGLNDNSNVCCGSRMCLNVHETKKKHRFSESKEEPEMLIGLKTL